MICNVLTLVFFTQNQYPLYDKNIYDESRPMLIVLTVALNNTIIESSYYPHDDQLCVVQNLLHIIVVTSRCFKNS